MLDPAVFKAYDVRGLYPGDLDEQGAYAVGRAYVGLTELTVEFHEPREQLAVAFELAEPVAETAEGDRELRLVAERFYDSMPEDVVAGGCNFLEPGGIDAWRAKAQQVFSRSA